MKYYMVFVCIALASSNFKTNCFPSRQTDNPCLGQPNGSFFKNPLGCKYFIFCNNGEANVGSCPDGLAFNPSRPPCDSEANVDCSEFETTELPTTPSTTTTTPPITTTTTTTTTTQPTTTRTTAPTTTVSAATTTSSTTTTTTSSTTTTTTSSTTTTTTSSTTTTTASSTTTLSTSTATVPTTTLPPTTSTTTTSLPTTTNPPVTTQRPSSTSTQSLTSTTIWPVTPEMPTASIPEIIKCPDEDPNQIVFLASNTHCSKYYICYHNKAIEMTCAQNLHWNLKTQKCDSIQESQCTVSPMPSFFPVCPRDSIGIYPHPLNCEWFLYCYLGHMTVQQCPFFYNWDRETQSCQLKTVAKCVLYSE